MATQNVTCISYFNKLTQGNVPFRESNYYGTFPVSAGGSDDWFQSSAGTNEYQCLGIDYTSPIYSSDGSTLNQPGQPYYMNFQNWKNQWADGSCKSLFQEMLLGGATGKPYAAFDPIGFKYVQDDFIFMLSRYFNHDITTVDKVSNIDINAFLSVNPIVDKSTSPVTELKIANIKIYDPVTNKKIVNYPFNFTIQDDSATSSFQIGTGPFQVGDSVTILWQAAAPIYPIYDSSITTKTYITGTDLATSDYVQGTINSIQVNGTSSKFTYTINVYITYVHAVTLVPPTPPATVSTEIDWTSGTKNFYFTYGTSNGDVYIGTSNNLANPGDQGYDKFLDVLLDSCASFPGVCEPIQSYMCSACGRQEIAASNVFTEFCGCLAPPDPNSFYKNISGNLDPSCDPLCTNSRAIKNVNTTTGIVEQCNANVCVINDVTIKAVDTSFNQAPNFTQVCPSCSDGTGNCVCIIDATFSDITSINDYNGNPINNIPRFNQVCPGAQCFVVDPATGKYVSKACEDSLYNSKGQLLKNLDLGPSVKFPIWIIIIGAVLLLAVFLTFIAYRYQTDNIAVYMVSKTKIY